MIQQPASVGVYVVLGRTETDHLVWLAGGIDTPEAARVIAMEKQDQYAELLVCKVECVGKRRGYYAWESAADS